MILTREQIDEIERNAGTTPFAVDRLLTHARASVAEIERLQKIVFDRGDFYECGFKDAVEACIQDLQDAVILSSAEAIEQISGQRERFDGARTVCGDDE